jgi:8-oxo-dGTP pyrophosphatase MutT (NUDIX family)
MSRVPAYPHPSATVLLLRNGDHNNLEVFMVVRHEDIAFMGGAMVFPGGRVDAADHVHAEAYRGAQAGEMPIEMLPLRIAAIRETFEEAGVLLVRDNATGQPVDHERAGRLQDARPRVEEDSGEFAKLLAAENLTVAPDLLVPLRPLDHAGHIRQTVRRPFLCRRGAVRSNCLPRSL